MAESSDVSGATEDLSLFVHPEEYKPKQLPSFKESEVVAEAVEALAEWRMGSGTSANGGGGKRISSLLYTEQSGKEGAEEVLSPKLFEELGDEDSIGYIVYIHPYELSYRTFTYLGSEERWEESSQDTDKSRRELWKDWMGEGGTHPGYYERDVEQGELAKALIGEAPGTVLIDKWEDSDYVTQRNYKLGLRWYAALSIKYRDQPIGHLTLDFPTQEAAKEAVSPLWGLARHVLVPLLLPCSKGMIENDRVDSIVQCFNPIVNQLGKLKGKNSSIKDLIRRNDLGNDEEILINVIDSIDIVSETAEGLNNALDPNVPELHDVLPIGELRDMIDELVEKIKSTPRYAFSKVIDKVKIEKPEESAPDVPMPQDHARNVLYELLTNSFRAIWDLSLTREREASFEQFYHEHRGGPPRINVSASRTDAGDVRLSIKDNGVGMSEEVRSRAPALGFSTRTGGTGIGLTIVNRIVQKNRGDILILTFDEADNGFVTQMDIILPDSA